MPIATVDFGTFASDGTGTVNWTNPDNAALSDGSLATASLSLSSESKELRCTNSDLSEIPLSARLSGNGVQCLVEASESGANIRLIDLFAFDGSSRVGNDQLSTTQDLTGSDVVYILGSGDWGFWTIDRLLSTTNGISIRAERTTGTPTARIDHVQLRVEWSHSATQSHGRTGRGRGR